MSNYERVLRDRAMIAAISGLASSGEPSLTIAEIAWDIAWQVVIEHRRRAKKYSRQEEEGY